MQLENDSPFHAIVQVADLLESELPAVVIVKATFDLADDGSLTPSSDPLPLVPDRLETPFGEFHGELYFKKQGADLCVLGTVRRSRAVQYARLRLSVGATFKHELLVSGDRHWLPNSLRDGLAPTDPIPFTELPLGYHRSYGGSAEFNGEPAPYPDNPVGIGYYLEATQAAKNRLPNIEAGNGPYIQRWNERARVAGWGPYPSYWGLRANSNVEVDPATYSVTRVSPGVFNHAHPELVFDTLLPDTPITVDGLEDTRRLHLRVPRPPAVTTVTIGTNTREVDAPIDGIFIWADERKVVITQRARFGYTFRPEEVRRAKVSLRN